MIEIRGTSIKRKDDRKIHKWDKSVQGKITQRLTGVISKETPTIWVNDKPVPFGNISNFKVEWKPYKPQFEWHKQHSKGKIHVNFKITGNDIHVVLDDQMPIGIMMCLIDRQNMLRTGRVHIKEDGGVFMQIGIWNGTKRNPKMNPVTLIINAFTIGWENIG